MPPDPDQSAQVEGAGSDVYGGLHVTGIDFVLRRAADRAWTVRDLVYPKTHTLVWVVSGRAIYAAGERTLRVAAGQMLFFPAGTRRSAQSDPADPWTFAAVGFFLGPASDAAATASRLAALPRQVTPPGDADVAPAMRELDRHWHEHAAGSQLRCGGIVSRLLGVYIQAATRPADPGGQRPGLDKVIDLLRQHPRRQYSVEMLARRAGLSPSRFRVLFRQATGTSALKYQNGMRVRRAAGLLRGGDHSVTEVAELVGYRDLFYFSRQFKQFMGVPPSAYLPR